MFWWLWLFWKRKRHLRLTNNLILKDKYINVERGKNPILKPGKGADDNKMKTNLMPNPVLHPWVAAVGLELLEILEPWKSLQSQTQTVKVWTKRSSLSLTLQWTCRSAMSRTSQWNPPCGLICRDSWLKWFLPFSPSPHGSQQTSNQLSLNR